MIPSTVGFLEQDFEIIEQPTKTYKMNLETNRICGYVDGLDAMKQAIFKILNTERYQYIMYSWDYGIETLDLYGEPMSYVCPELERRITEALLIDARITGIADFVHDAGVKRVLYTKFTVYTVFGDVAGEKVVNF